MACGRNHTVAKNMQNSFGPKSKRNNEWCFRCQQKTEHPFSSIELSEFEWVHVFETSLSWINDVRFLWSNWDSLGGDFLSFFLSLNLKSIILLNSLDESESASWLSHMFNSDANSLWDDSSIDKLVHDNSASMSGHVKDSTGFSVIEFVWHTFMYGTVSNDINVITDFVSDEISGEWGSTMLFVWSWK